MLHPAAVAMKANIQMDRQTKNTVIDPTVKRQRQAVVPVKNIIEEDHHCLLD